MKEIKDRDRTLDAVVNPNKYIPLSNITDIDSFEKAWTTP